MRLLAACSLGGQGHLDSLIPFLNAARDRGDDVLVVGPTSMGEAVKRTGHQFWAGAEPSEEEVAPIREQLPVASPAEASVLANRELFGRLATQAILPAMEAAFDTWRPDLVLREPCEYASAILARRSSAPAAQVAISLADAEQGSITTASPALGTQDKGITSWLQASPYLSRFPASIDPSTFVTTTRYRPTGPPATVRLPDWWPDRGKDPLVYVTFGTVLGYMSTAALVYRMALAAVGNLPARVLLTFGRRFDPALLGTVPDNVRIESWVDQADVLAEADLVVCHGGSGTVVGALAAGVPSVVVPIFADQFENGRRVARSGAGILIASEDAVSDAGRTPVTEVAAPLLAEAIATALADDSYRVAAKSVASELAGYRSVKEVLAGLAMAVPSDS